MGGLGNMRTSSIFLPTGRDSFYSRLTVPLQVQRFLGGRKEVWKSLRTADKELAQVRASTWQAAGRQLFHTLKRYGDRMTKADIEHLVQRWLDTALDEAEASRPTVVTDQWRRDRDEGLSVHNDSLMESMLSFRYDRMTEDADDLLKSAGLPAMDHQSQAFKHLCRRLLEAHLEYTRLQQERLDGGYQPFHRHSFHPTQSATTPLPPTKMFSEVVKLYYEENPPRSARSGFQVQSELKRFTETIGGDCPIGQITKDHCRTYKESLLKARGLSLVTASKWLGIVSTIFRWAIRQGFVHDAFKNPVDGLAPNAKRAKAESKSHRDYTDEELLTVFGSTHFLKQREARPDYYWMVLICLFTGCRREEAAQLYLDDIQVQDGIHFFNFTDEGEDQGLKCDDSRRKVPIHSALLSLGFMEYMQAMRQSNAVRLFPRFKKGKSTYADAAGKWYSRLLRKRLGLTDKTLVLHGLRSTVITRLSNVGVAEKIHRMLTGHASDDVHGKVYDRRERVPMKLLQEGLEKLRYDELIQALSNGQREEAA